MTTNHLLCNVAEYAVIMDDQQRVLIAQIVQHVKDIGGKWNLPGGRMHEGEQAGVGVVRETQEETGLQVEPAHIVFTYFDHNTYRVFYMCSIDGLKEVKLSHEHQAFEWIALENMDQYVFCSPAFFGALKAASQFIASS